MTGTIHATQSQLMQEVLLVRDWLRETGGDETVWGLVQDDLDLDRGIEGEKKLFRHVASSLEFSTSICEPGIQISLRCSDGQQAACPSCYIRFPEAADFIMNKVHHQHGIDGRLERRGTHEMLWIWTSPSQVGVL